MQFITWSVWFSLDYLDLMRLTLNAYLYKLVKTYLRNIFLKKVNPGDNILPTVVPIGMDLDRQGTPDFTI